MTWIVVGATAGLGRSLAQSLASRKKSLLLVAKDERDLEALASDLAIRFGVPVRTLAGDAADHEALAGRIASALDPVEPIDGLLFPLGLTVENDEGALSPREADRIVAVNFLSVVSVVGRLLPEMSFRGRGVIAGFGSVAGSRGRRRNVVYAAAKRALASYFESLRHLCDGGGVRVMFFVMGYLDTNQTFGRPIPLPRLDPAAAADAICDLLGGKSGVHFVPAYWRPLAAILRVMPWTMFRRLRV